MFLQSIDDLVRFVSSRTSVLYVKRKQKFVLDGIDKLGKGVRSRRNNFLVCLAIC